MCRMNKMGRYRADHGAAQPQAADGSQARIDQGKGADDLDHAGDNAKPLAEPDLVKQLNHERNAGQLGRTGGKKRRGNNALQSPGTDATGRLAGFNAM